MIGREGELAGRSFAGTPAQFDASLYGPTGLLAYVEPRHRDPARIGNAMRNIVTIVALLLVVATAESCGGAGSRPPLKRKRRRTSVSRLRHAPTCSSTGAGFPVWTVTPDTGRLEPDTLDVRRLRAGIDGRWRRWSFEASVDPLDDLDDTLIKDAYVQYRVSRGLRLRGGQFKLPGGREVRHLGGVARLP